MHKLCVLEVDNTEYKIPEKVIKSYQKLQQENQQLKEKNKQLKEKIIILQASEPMLELTKYYGERDKYKSIVEELKKYIKIEKEKNLQLGTSTNDLEYRAYFLALQVKLCEIEDKIKELEEEGENNE